MNYTATDLLNLSIPWRSLLLDTALIFAASAVGVGMIIWAIGGIQYLWYERKWRK